MGLLLKTAWRNLWRHRRRTLITLGAMTATLALAIPLYALTLGRNAELLRGITGMELGHLQVHDPSFPGGRGLQSTLDHPERVLRAVRETPGVAAAAARVYGHALASHDRVLSVGVRGVDPLDPTQVGRVRSGRALGARPAAAGEAAKECEAVVDQVAAQRAGLTVGAVLTPRGAPEGGACERVRIVGLSADEQGVASAEAGGEAAQRPALTLTLSRSDAMRGFGAVHRTASAVLRQVAPVSIVGVEAEAERQVTFLAEKLVQGRYLSAAPADEVMLGKRLAQVLRLSLGDELFVQAASLEPAAGTNYQRLEVVGIFHTGLELVDRTRVFVPLVQAQRLVSLDARAHEVAVVALDPGQLGPLAARLRERLSPLSLRATTEARGLRSGSRPLPAPVTVVEHEEGDAGLLLADDLKRRLAGVEGLDSISRRVYGTTQAALAQELVVKVETRSRAELARALGGAPLSDEPCAVFLAAPLRERLRAEVGTALEVAAGGGEEACRRVRVAGFVPAALARSAEVVVTAGADDDEPGLRPGPLKLLLAARGRPLRFVGLEPALEAASLWTVQTRGAGRFLEEGAEDQSAWVVASERAAAALGASLGARLMLRTRDGDGRTRWRSGQLVGLLRDTAWPAELPELLLPYFAAQQVDAPTLNARAHELALRPRTAFSPTQLAESATARMRPLVRTWPEIAPALARIVLLQEAITALVLAIVFGVAAVTVTNTMLMAVFERTRELGVLRSLGMGPGRVFGLIVLEVAFVALLAALLGGALGLGLGAYLAEHGLDLSAYTSGFSYEGILISPVWKAVLTVKSVILPVAMMAFICLCAALLPAWRAVRLRPVEALRQEG